MFATLSGLAISGCSQTPPIKVRHYLPKTETAVTVNQVVTCNAESAIVSAASVTTETSYSADTRDAQVIDMSGYGSSLADTGLTFLYYGDGRLQGINATSTGKGGEIVKSAIGLLTTVAGRNAPAADRGPQKVACDNIKQWGKGEPITLTYKGTIEYMRIAPALPNLPPDATSFARHKALASAIGYVCPVVSFPLADDIDAFVEPTKGVGRVPLRQPVNVQLDLFVDRSPECTGSQRDYQIHSDTVPVSEAGKVYWVPIPRPAPFGKQTFALTLAESGALTKLQYDTEPGAAQALDAAKDVAGAALETDAEVTARANAEIAKIKALSALVKCKADPTQCGV